MPTVPSADFAIDSTASRTAAVSVDCFSVARGLSSFGGSAATRAFEQERMNRAGNTARVMFNSICFIWLFRFTPPPLATASPYELLQANGFLEGSFVEP